MGKISRRRMIGLIAATVSAPGAGLAGRPPAAGKRRTPHERHYPRCEYLTNPLGIGETKPRLSWLLNSPGAGRGRLPIKSWSPPPRSVSRRATATWWDSGRVAGDQSAQVEYAGRPLPSRARCFWKVRAWGPEGKATAWSPVAHWTMGLLTPDAWSAQWIGMGDGTPDTPGPASALSRCQRPGDPAPPAEDIPGGESSSGGPRSM